MKFIFGLFLILPLIDANGQLICRDRSTNCMLENDLENEPKRAQKDLNVFSTQIQLCSSEPLTGFFRNGFCQSDKRDRGNHSVCAVMTEEFLNYTLEKGNDLITPNTRYGFPGLKPGDRWCLCAARWLEARQAGVITEVIPAASHKRALEVISLRFFEKSP